MPRDLGSDFQNLHFLEPFLRRHHQNRLKFDNMDSSLNSQVPTSVTSGRGPPRDRLGAAGTGTRRANGRQTGIPRDHRGRFSPRHTAGSTHGGAPGELPAAAGGGGTFRLDVEAPEFHSQLVPPQGNIGEGQGGYTNPVPTVRSEVPPPPMFDGAASEPAGARLLASPLSGRPNFMSTTPARHFVVVTPHAAAGATGPSPALTPTRSTGTPHTWSGGTVQTVHGALPSPFRDEADTTYAAGQTGSAARTSSFSSRGVLAPRTTWRRPSHTPAFERSGHRDEQPSRSDIDDWRLRKEGGANASQPNPDGKMAGSVLGREEAKHILSHSAFHSDASQPSPSWPSNGGGVGVARGSDGSAPRQVHTPNASTSLTQATTEPPTSVLHTEATTLTSTITESPIPVLHVEAATMTPTSMESPNAELNSACTTSSARPIQLRSEIQGQLGQLMQNQPGALHTSRPSQPRQMRSQASVSWEDHNQGVIPIRHVAVTGPTSVNMGSRRERRRQRMEQHLQRQSGNVVTMLPARSGQSGEGSPHHPRRGISASASSEQNQALTHVSGHSNMGDDLVMALRQEVATYMEDLQQKLLQQYSAVYHGLPAAAMPSGGNSSVPPDPGAALTNPDPETTPPSPQPASDSPSEVGETPPAKPPSDPSPPPSSDGEQSSPRLEVLLWTPQGESLWLKRRPNASSVIIQDPVSTEACYRLPSLSGQSTVASSDVNKMWLTLQHIGLDIRNLAEHGPVRSPLRLTEIVDCVAFALQVDRVQIDVARKNAEQRPGPHHRRLPQYSWVTIPSTARESELEDFDSLGLQLWAALIATEDYLFRSLPTSSTGHHVPETAAPTAPTQPTKCPVTPAAGNSSLPLQRPLSGILPIDPQRTQFPGYHELMGDVSPDTVYRESKTVADIMKLCKDVPMYPSSAELVSTDADIAALPPFTEALVSLITTGVVSFALNRMSAYRLDKPVISMAELLREISQRRLQPRSLAFLKQGGMMNTDAWNQRYTSLAPFLADVARSVLDDVALVGLAGNVMRMTQRRDEAARMFAARLVSWHEVTQLLSETMAGCLSISNQQILYQFWSGLRLRQAVMDKLMDDKLDLQSPTNWEERHPGSTALQHVILVATKLERSETLNAARQPPPATSPSSGRSPWRGNRSTPRLNAIHDAGEEEETEGADLRIQHSVPSAPPGLTRPPRRCYVCNSDSHLWANCPDEAKKKAWIADAPARLARRRANNDAQVAALEADLEDLEDEADALEYFQNGESTAAASSEPLSADEED